MARCSSVKPPRRLVQTFEHEYSKRHGGGPEDRSRVTSEIEPRGRVCKLSVTHDQWKDESKSFRSAREGWPMVLSSLKKTLLETGEALALDSDAPAKTAAL